jgi:hypothetical protein
MALDMTTTTTMNLHAAAISTNSIQKKQKRVSFSRSEDGDDDANDDEVSVEMIPDDLLDKYQNILSTDATATENEERAARTLQRFLRQNLLHWIRFNDRESHLLEELEYIQDQIQLDLVRIQQDKEEQLQALRKEAAEPKQQQAQWEKEQEEKEKILANSRRIEHQLQAEMKEEKETQFLYIQLQEQAQTLDRYKKQVEEYQTEQKQLEADIQDTSQQNMKILDTIANIAALLIEEYHINWAQLIQVQQPENPQEGDRPAAEDSANQDHDKQDKQEKKKMTSVPSSSARSGSSQTTRWWSQSRLMALSPSQKRLVCI